MPGPAAAALASEGGDIADAASDSKGANIAMALIALGVVYYMYKGVNTATDIAEDTADGVGDAGQAVGETAGDAYEGTQDMVGDVWEGGQDVARGTGDAVSEGADWWFGGAADTVEGAGDAAGDTADYVGGGLQDTVDDAGDAIGGLI